MGKTASGAAWLSDKRLPAYDYWQYWRNTEDNDVGRASLRISKSTCRSRRSGRLEQG